MGWRRPERSSRVEADYLALGTVALVIAAVSMASALMLARRPLETVVMAVVFFIGFLVITRPRSSQPHYAFRNLDELPPCQARTATVLRRSSTMLMSLGLVLVPLFLFFLLVLHLAASLMLLYAATSTAAAGFRTLRQRREVLRLEHGNDATIWFKSSDPRIRPVRYVVRSSPPVTARPA